MRPPAQQVGARRRRRVMWVRLAGVRRDVPEATRCAVRDRVSHDPSLTRRGGARRNLTRGDVLWFLRDRSPKVFQRPLVAANL